jgi:ParB family transcriptional regulator, chromosome partitioning protein
MGRTCTHPKEIIMALMSPNKIKTHPTFENLFPIKPELLARIEANMKAGDYDDSQNVIVATWEGQNEPVCVDGHTRIRAAINAGINEIPTKTHHFETENEALEYAIRLQANRRNMEDADILKCVMALDQRRARGGDRRSDEAKSKPQDCGIENSRSASAKYTAELLGISTRKVEQSRTVMDQADPETLEAVQTGKMSINKACNVTQERRKAEKAAAEGEEAQTVPSPENAPEEADAPNEDEESFEGAGAEDADHPDADEDTYEDALDEAVAYDEPNQGPHDHAPEDEVDEGPEDDGAIEDEAEEVPMSNEGVINPVMDTTVTIAPELYQALESLGGSVEEHVAMAIEAYLSSMGQADAYDPKEEKLAKIAADVLYGLAAESDKEPEEDDYDDGSYDDQDLLWAEPVLTASAAA